VSRPRALFASHRVSCPCLSARHLTATNILDEHPRQAEWSLSRVPWNFGGGPVSIRLRSPGHHAHGADRFGNLAFVRGAECG
jgi:hypothetical protein